MDVIIKRVFLISLGGALGTVARYGLSGLVQRFTGSLFPYGTLAVNLLGSFLAGFIWFFTENKFQISNEYRTIVLIGFMGAFTTFSTFMLETGRMIQDEEWLRAGGNLMLQNGVGILALFTGIILARLLS